MLRSPFAFVTLPVTLGLLFFSGCREAEVMPPPEHAISTIPHLLDLGPWKEFVQEAPVLMQIEKPGPGLRNLLEEGEKLVTAVVASVGAEEDLSYLEPFRSRLELLIANPPENVAVYGYYRPSYRTTKRAFASDGSAGFHSVYDGGYSSGSYEANASASLIRAIQNTVKNANFDNLENTIDWLQGRHESWSRKTAQLASSGMQVYEKQANMQYLSNLRDYINQWINLKNEILQAKAQSSGLSREEILERWQAFKSTKLRLIEHELTAAGAPSIGPGDDGVYRLPKSKESSTIVIGKIKLGSELVYLPLLPKRADRPVQLTAIGM